MAGKGANAGPPTGVVEKNMSCRNRLGEVPKCRRPAFPKGRERERQRDRGVQGGAIERCSRQTGGGFCAGGGGWDASFGNSGSVVTTVTMVCHAMGTVGLVVGEKRGRVQAWPLPSAESSHSCAIRRSSRG